MNFFIAHHFTSCDRLLRLREINDNMPLVLRGPLWSLIIWILALGLLQAQTSLPLLKSGLGREYLFLVKISIHFDRVIEGLLLPIINLLQTKWWCPSVVALTLLIARRLLMDDGIVNVPVLISLLIIIVVHAWLLFFTICLLFREVFIEDQILHASVLIRIWVLLHIHSRYLLFLFVLIQQVLPSLEELSAISSISSSLVTFFAIIITNILLHTTITAVTRTLSTILISRRFRHIEAIMRIINTSIFIRRVASKLGAIIKLKCHTRVLKLMLLHRLWHVIQILRISVSLYAVHEWAIPSLVLLIVIGT